ncbi:class I SAM-dependent methyltransferase [Thermoproteota archaeon]
MARVAKKDFEKWNEKMFVKYNNERMYFHPNLAIRYTENKRVRTIIRMLNIRPKDKVIELGCGEGYILDLLPKADITGVDLSKEAVRWAKDRLKKKRYVKVLKGDATKTGLKKDSFDKVYATEVIEHILEPKKLVDEIIRLAKKESTIVVTFPNEDLINNIKKYVAMTGLYDILLKDVPKKMNDEWHLHVFNLKKFRSVVKNRLEILEMKAVPFWFFPVRYIAKCRVVEKKTGKKKTKK